MQSIPPSKRTKVYNYDYITTFQAVLSYCNDVSFAVTMADKDLGIINTDFKENEGTSKFFFGNFRAKLNFYLKKQSESSIQVIINASGERQGAFGSWTQSTMTEQQAIELYQQIFSGIDKQLRQNSNSTSPETSNNLPLQGDDAEFNSFTLELKSEEPTTLFGGRVSLTYFNAFSGKSKLSGKGVWGFSKYRDGKYDSIEINISKGETVYLQTDETIIFEIFVEQERYNSITLVFKKLL